MWLTCKHVVPVMRAQGGGGAIVNISSLAAVASAPMLAYKTSKAAVNSLTESLAGGNAKHGIRANAIMPGLMDTPMAIESISAGLGVDKDQLRSQRAATVPLGRRMGTAWDVAYAVLFLASDEANFITGVILARRRRPGQPGRLTVGARPPARPVATATDEPGDPIATARRRRRRRRHPAVGRRLAGRWSPACRRRAQVSRRGWRR